MLVKTVSQMQTQTHSALAGSGSEILYLSNIQATDAISIQSVSQQQVCQSATALPHHSAGGNKPKQHKDGQHYVVHVCVKYVFILSQTSENFLDVSTRFQFIRVRSGRRLPSLAARHLQRERPDLCLFKFSFQLHSSAVFRLRSDIPLSYLDRLSVSYAIFHRFCQASVRFMSGSERKRGDKTDSPVIVF